MEILAQNLVYLELVQSFDLRAGILQIIAVDSVESTVNRVAQRALDLGAENRDVPHEVTASERELRLGQALHRQISDLAVHLPQDEAAILRRRGTRPHREGLTLPRRLRGLRHRVSASRKILDVRVRAVIQAALLTHHVHQTTDERTVFAERHRRKVKRRKIRLPSPHVERLTEMHAGRFERPFDDEKIEPLRRGRGGNLGAITVARR